MLKKLSKAVAQDELNQPFWVRKYFISPMDRTVQGSGADQCIHYRVRITTPKRERKKRAEPAKPRKNPSQKKVRKNKMELVLVHIGVQNFG